MLDVCIYDNHSSCTFPCFVMWARFKYQCHPVCACALDVVCDASENQICFVEYGYSSTAVINSGAFGGLCGVGDLAEYIVRGVSHFGEQIKLGLGRVFVKVCLLYYYYNYYYDVLHTTYKVLLLRLQLLRLRLILLILLLLLLRLRLRLRRLLLPLLVSNMGVSQHTCG